jgi:hypothetical protein
MLSSIMLDDTFKAIIPEVSLAGAANEEFFSILFGQRLDLVVIYPFHIFQDQSLPRSWVGVVQILVLGAIGNLVLLGNIGIEPLTGVNQKIRGEPGTAVIVN